MTRVDYRQGDYRIVADRLRPAAEALVGAVGPAAGDLVVDVGAGTGNVSRLCAERGARAVAVDLFVEQLVLGRDGDRSIGWVAGDAHDLPLADGIADAVLSTFAVIYAERPVVAVAELARVCRPGATIGLTSWAAGSFQDLSARILRDVGGLEGSDGHDHIAVWGSPEAIASSLRTLDADLSLERRTLESRFASVDAWWERVSTTAPPIVGARARLDEETFHDLGARFREVAADLGRHDDGFVLVEEYLVAVARTRG